MWIINDDDIEFLRDSRDGSVNVHQPLAARCGLYFQPYCASVPMPREVLSRCVMRHFPFSVCTLYLHFAIRFKLLGAMMAKAVQDGRAFPLRISYALARCICGESLDFDDLSSVFNFHYFSVSRRVSSLPSERDALIQMQALKQIRSSASGAHEWSLVFSQPTNIVEEGCIVSRQLHLVKGGDQVDVVEANASEYLRGIERLYLGDGIALQARALQSGFYSIISQEKISILGPSGLLHHLGALSCPEFDPEDLRLGFEPKFGYSVDSPQYSWLIQTLLTFDEDQRRATVRFLTGSPSLPSGFQGLPKRLTVQLLTTQANQPAGDSYLPVIQACAGLFKLPRFVVRRLTIFLNDHVHLSALPTFPILCISHASDSLVYRYTSSERLREKLLFAIYAKFELACFSNLHPAF